MPDSNTTPEALTTKSSRDTSTIPALLEGWLAPQLPAGADPSVALVGGSATNGMSSETLLVDITWTEGGAREVHRMVARVAPSNVDVPVFPTYDLEGQYDAMRLSGELTDVPVPTVRWIEPTGELLGSPFFLMEAIDGIVPPDNLPYTFGDNWLFDASPAQQKALVDNTIAAIAGLHSIPNAPSVFDFLNGADAGDADAVLRAHVAKTREWYEWAIPDIGASPLAERGFAWLEDNWPDVSGEDVVLSWGDARIGNVLYRDFAPVGVLDWEMAGLGPRALDLGWMIFAHDVFQGIASMLELPGLPDLMRVDNVRATYQQLTGVDVGDLSWYLMYSAVQWCVVFMRTGARQIHFGEIERPAVVDDLFHHRALIEKMLAEGVPA